MRLTRSKLLAALPAPPTTGQDTLIDNALRYQRAAMNAWNKGDMKEFRQMEKEFRFICEKLGINKSPKKENKPKTIQEKYGNNKPNKKKTEAPKTSN